MTLIEMNAGAARRFYQFASGHLPPARTIRFILALHQTLKHCIAEGEKRGGVYRDGEVDLKRKKDEPALGEGETHTADGSEVLRNHVAESKDCGTLAVLYSWTCSCIGVGWVVRWSGISFQV